MHRYIHVHNIFYMCVCVSAYACVRNILQINPIVVAHTWLSCYNSLTSHEAQNAIVAATNHHSSDVAMRSKQVLFKLVGCSITIRMYKQLPKSVEQLFIML